MQFSYTLQLKITNKVISVPFELACDYPTFKTISPRLTNNYI